MDFIMFRDVQLLDLLDDFHRCQTLVLHHSFAISWSGLFSLQDVRLDLIKVFSYCLLVETTELIFVAKNYVFVGGLWFDFDYDWVIVAVEF